MRVKPNKISRMITLFSLEKTMKARENWITKIIYRIKRSSLEEHSDTATIMTMALIKSKNNKDLEWQEDHSWMSKTTMTPLWILKRICPDSVYCKTITRSGEYWQTASWKECYQSRSSRIEIWKTYRMMKSTWNTKKMSFIQSRWHQSWNHLTLLEED
jgi:hypothetical protein